jgi:hypothetical protein
LYQMHATYFHHHNDINSSHCAPGQEIHAHVRLRCLFVSIN